MKLNVKRVFTLKRNKTEIAVFGKGENHCELKLGTPLFYSTVTFFVRFSNTVVGVGKIELA